MKQPPLVENPELGASPPPAPPPQNIPNTTPFDRRPQPRRNSPWKTFFKAIFMVLLVSGLGVGAYLKFTESGRATGALITEGVQTIVDHRANPDALFTDAQSDIVNILLIGRDVNWKVGKVYDPKTKRYRSYQVYDEEAPARSDTMIVVSLDKLRNQIHMISLPRDARVHMPENKYHVGRAKLNAAHAYGGPELLMQTIHDELGLTIHHYAVIRFEGFKKLIDQVKGVEVDVIGALKRDGKRHNLVYDDNWGNLHINLKPGKQVLDGEQAHSYVRFRMDLEGDPGRIRRQQQVMRALAKSLMNQPWYKIPPLVQEVRKQFKTDLTNVQIASAASFAKNIGDSGKIQPVTMFGVYSSRGNIILNEQKNIKLFNYLFGNTFDETRFLQNSPSTRRDEMGEENNSSPEAQAILRHAGLIKGVAGDPPLHSGRSVDPGVPSNMETSSEPVINDYSPSRLANSDETSPSTSERRRSKRKTRRSRETASLATPERSSPVRDDAGSVDLSVPEEGTQEDTSSSTARESSGESDSPAPEPESVDSSPVPAAE